jgi:uncharacterized protein (TIGR02266 family)
MQDRRETIRYEINREFQSVDEFLREYALNVSATGAFIKTPEPLPIGTKVRLKFTVIVEDFETIEGVGKVVRCVKPGEGEPAGIGVVFVSLSPHSREILAKLFLEDHHEQEA